MARTHNDEDGGEMRFPPERIRKLLIELRNSLALTEGRPQKLEDLEHLTGRSHGTIGSWFEGAPMQQVEFIFSLVERLPQELRHRLIDRTCRPHPTILHPNLVQDPLAVLRLEAIIRQPAGLTIVRGQELPRTFLFAAIANSIQHVRQGKVLVYGVDTQILPWATPKGVANLNSCRDGNQLKRAISQIKSAPDGSVILLGGEWANRSDLGAELGRLASRCNVIATEAAAAPISGLRPRPDNIQVLTVSRMTEQPEWLAIKFQPVRT